MPKASKEAATAGLPQFDPPAFQNDLPNDPSNEQIFRSEWSNSVKRWTLQSILGDPWTVLYDNNRTYYYNPLVEDISGGTPALIAWTAYPNRILTTYPNASFQEQMAYADGGPYSDGSYGPPPLVNGNPYRPRGPRGWQDEYCEWIVLRNADGKITQIDFTCENPEYWYTLWRISPETVLSLSTTRRSVSTIGRSILAR